MRCRCRDTMRDTDSREAERRRDCPLVVSPGPQPARLKEVSSISFSSRGHEHICSTQLHDVLYAAAKEVSSISFSFVGRAKATNI